MKRYLAKQLKRVQLLHFNAALVCLMLFLVVCASLETRSAWGPGVIVPQVRDSFTSGGNFFYTAGRFMYRKVATGPTDKGFDQRAYIDLHRELIPHDYLSKFMGTKNEIEADWLLADMQDTIMKHRLLEARGFWTSQLAWWIGSGLAPLLYIVAVYAFVRYQRKSKSSAQL